MHIKSFGLWAVLASVDAAAMRAICFPSHLWKQGLSTDTRDADFIDPTRCSHQLRLKHSIPVLDGVGANS